MKKIKSYNNPQLLTLFGENGFNYASQNFNRDIIAKQLFDELNSLTQSINEKN